MRRKEFARHRPIVGLGYSNDAMRSIARLAFCIKIPHKSGWV
jgi:hypothetical protein